MGVHIDKTGGNHLTAHIKTLAGMPIGEAADRHNPVVTHRDIGAAQRGAPVPSTTSPPTKIRSHVFDCSAAMGPPPEMSAFIGPAKPDTVKRSTSHRLVMRR